MTADGAAPMGTGGHRQSIYALLMLTTAYTLSYVDRGLIILLIEPI
jgi:hypothetical protein